MITSLVLNVESGEWYVDGREQHPLTMTSKAILGLLLEKAPHVVTKRDFEVRVWGGREVDFQNIRVLIANLRKKLRTAGATAEIEGLRGGRYRLVEPSDPQP